MKERNVSRADLARKLGKSRAYVTQLLDGESNMTLETISSVMFALGHRIRVEAVDLSCNSGLLGDSPTQAELIPFKTVRPESAVSVSGPADYSSEDSSPPNYGLVG
jgi:transcriptional regulator with XRE-family HTH domain